MKFWKKAAVVAALVSVPTLAMAEYYKLNVRRIDSNMYVDKSARAMIKTRYCYEYTYGDDVILEWSGSNYMNCGTLIFKNGSKCQVDGVYEWSD